MNSYNISLNGDILTIGFGVRADNDVIVKDAAAALTALGQIGGKRLLISGPCSLAAGFVICHHVSHLFGYVAVFDPKMNSYVVAISHSPEAAVGDLIPA